MLHQEQQHRLIDTPEPYVVPVRIGCFACGKLTRSPLRLEDEFATPVCSVECARDALRLIDSGGPASKLSRDADVPSQTHVRT